MCNKLTDHLDFLLQLSCSPESSINYRNPLKGQPTLCDLTTYISELNLGVVAGHRYSSSGPVARIWSLPNDKLVYYLQILKKIILTRFQLLCVCAELKDDVEYSYEECKVMCKSAQICNSTFPSNKMQAANPRRNTPIEFAEFIKIVVSSHSKLILQSILSGDLSPENIAKMARFEKSFITALCGILGTYTTLLTPNKDIGQQQKVYVSEEMFVMNKEGGNVQDGPVSWLDCIIPGAQSEVLRQAGKDVVSKLWERVGLELLANLQPALNNGKAITTLIQRLTFASQHEDLSHHNAVTSCLWHVSSSLFQQQQLSLWDSAFQKLLVSTQVDSRRSFKHPKDVVMTTTTGILVQELLPPVEDHMTKMSQSDIETPSATNISRSSYSVIAHHANVLRLSRPLSGALAISLIQSVTFLIQGLRGSLANWNLRSLAQLLFVEAPTIRIALEKVTGASATVACPRYSFPPSCLSLHSIERVSRDDHSNLHRHVALLKDMLESFSVAFHDTWTQKCAHMLKEKFPSTKSWRAQAKKSDRQRTPSAYCDIVIEHLLYPAIEAACASLSGEPQKNFVYLTVCILANELRKIITAHKKTYTTASGRQLLVDLRHIQHWLTSTDLGLCKGSLQLLSNFQILQWLEHGILTVCGTVDNDQVDFGTESSLLLHEAAKQYFYNYLQYRQLQIFNDMAWSSNLDWSVYCH